MTVPRDTPAPIGKGQRIGHYEIVEEIGRGGMGIVYRARDASLKRDVAIKVLPPEVARDPDRVKRFQREARAAAALDHPHILAVHELGEHAGRPFIVTELLEGHSLREVLAGHGLTPGKAVEYAGQIAEALAAAHDKGIVHRDLKPGNVFITADGRVKILDFGLARLTEQAEGTGSATASVATETGSVVGTPGYMAPEQVRGEQVDRRADIFALGCVLYEMLTRRRPFYGETSAEVMTAILREDPARLSEVANNLSSGLERIVERCLEKRPEGRFSSARDVRLALGTVSHDAVAVTTGRTASRWRRAAVIAALLATAAVAAIGINRLRPFLLKPQLEQRSQRIAVLPLENLSGHEEREFFSDGMTHTLTAELGTISSLEVIGSRSAMQFKGTDTPVAEIARVLDVDFLLAGSVVSSQNRVLVAVELIDPSDDRLVWSRSFERDVADIVSLQGEIARAIGREIHLTLTPEEKRRLARSRQVNRLAHEAYLMGVYFDVQDWWKSLEYFEKAVELDPDFAEAHAALASVLMNLAGDGRVNVADAQRRARDSIETALAIDPELAEGYNALARFNINFEWDWERAEAAYKRAVELNPNDQFSYGFFLASTGQYDRGLEKCEAALRNDPLSLSTMAWLTIVFCCGGRYDDARAVLERAREINPDFKLLPIWSGIIAIAEGRYDDAVAACDRAGDSEYCGQIYAMAGKREKALERIEAITSRQYFAPFYVAGIYAGLGEMDDAIAWLEEAYEQHHPWLAGWMEVPMVREVFANEPRFQDIRRRMGLPYTSGQ